MSVSFSNNSALLLSGSKNGIAFIWCRERADLIQTITCKNKILLATYFNTDSSHLLTVHSDDVSIVWHVDTGIRVSQLTKPAYNPVSHPCFMWDHLRANSDISFSQGAILSAFFYKILSYSRLENKNKNWLIRTFNPQGSLQVRQGHEG